MYQFPKKRNQAKTPKEKSISQEKNLARKLSGRTTLGSGNLHFDKADVVAGERKHHNPSVVRIEAKRTDAESISFKKEWITKLKRETQPREFWAMELEIQDEKVYVISENEFKYLISELTK